MSLIPEFLVTALYSFEASDDGELTFKTGDKIVVISVDEGWWTGYLADDPSKVGMFPYNYVERVGDNDQETEDELDKKNEKEPKEIEKNPKNKKQKEEKKSNIKNNGNIEIEIEKENTTKNEEKTNEDSPKEKRQETVVNPNEKYIIEEGFKWSRNPTKTYLEVSITGTEKRGNFKKFLTYEIHTEPGNHKVYHRYSHFFWLYEQLRRMFPNIRIPILPEKKATGKFKEAFIQSRKKDLEKFLKRVAQHPVLSECYFFLDFLQNDKEIIWEESKRKVERDHRSFWRTVETVPVLSDDVTENQTKQNIQKFKSHNILFEQAFKLLHKNLDDINLLMKQCSLVSKELSSSMNHVADISLDWNKSVDSEKNSLQSTELKLDSFLKHFSSFWKGFSEELLKKTEEERALISNFGEFNISSPSFIDVFKNFEISLTDLHSKMNLLAKAETKSRNVEEIQKISEESKKKMVISSSITLAEINHFHSIRIKDIKQILQKFVDIQHVFYTKILKELEEIKPEIDSIKIDEN
ncbi:sorting nexin [Anaeramoeba ignava]|uniref:Sorting nexin n=1 Tax=Anaeramoeba ignava TaxID=1746090 RepID=A0A9Q0R518_ANAIG|nr:sorting nexin [Anaeramoeba ignava]